MSFEKLSDYCGRILLVLVLLIQPVLAENGVTKTEILLGSSLALEGHASYLGLQTIHGALAYLNEINESGGIYGRKIKVITYNDGYEPEPCIQNTNKLINEDQVFALFCYVGTPTSVKIIPIVEKAQIPLLGLFTGAEVLREPVKRYIFNVRASYYDETGGMIQHFWEDLGVRKIAVFYQNDDYGQAGLAGVELALRKYQSIPVAEGTYERGSEDITNALQTIRKANPEAVVMIGVYGPCARFIQSAKWSGFNPYFHNVSFVGAKQMARLLGAGRDSDGVIVTQVVPPPTSAHAAIEQYRQLLKKHYPQEAPSFVSLEGFMNAKVLVGILKKVGPNLTRERFIQVAERLTDFDLGMNIAISYSPENHRGLNQVYYTIIKNSKYELITDWKAVKAARQQR